MANPTNYSFTYKELVEALVRAAGLTEGIWGIQIHFGMNATNLGADDDLRPAAVLAVHKIGLQSFDRVTSLSVDAAELAKRDGGAKERKKG